jgi:SulP family sulfate permease
VVREGYGWSKLRADAAAGLTVAVVALPLSMGIAVASGASPERGLVTAIVGGFLGLGTYIKYIPHPVIVGFSAGIAVIIATSQVRDLLGLSLPGKEPAPLLPKLQALVEAWPTVTRPPWPWPSPSARWR